MILLGSVGGRWIASWTPTEGTPIVSHQSDQSLLRTVRCIDGEVEVEIECRPNFDYGRGLTIAVIIMLAVLPIMIWNIRRANAEEGTR